jgi:tRNA A-37 threonylcarbamoyl transferase component Bud32
VTSPAPRTPREPVDVELLARADHAERTGDARGAAEALRSLVARHPDDVPARLRFARALFASGHGPAARRALEPLDGRDGAAPEGHEADVHRAFALLDEAEGALAAAAERWERVLADDVDDAEALTHLAALRPAGAPARVGVAETLVSPDGLEALRYRLRRELGRGATAAVYLATDETLGIDVALKVLHPQLASVGRAESRRRFFAEGRLAAAARHRGVVAIYDVDEAARVLTMEYVAGGTLRARLAAAGAPLPSAEIAATSASLLETLAFVHDRGIVHGDLKPSNLLVRGPGDVVLADFGAAQLRGEVAPTGDGPGGTPQYLAPEQLRGGRAAPATDLYAAGAVLWEMATGRPLRRHADLLRGTAPPAHLPPASARALGSRLAALVDALVAQDPEARPASARAARDSL